MGSSPRRKVAVAVGGALAAGAAGAAGYLGLVTGTLPVDLGVGRRTRPLGPLTLQITAPRGLVYDLIVQPYLGRTTTAMREKVQVLERGSDLVLAAHRTPVRGRLVATTVETVRFTPPERIDFRLVRGPVPQVTESVELTEQGDGTRLHYTGELGTDLWALGRAWGNGVAARWEAVVQESFAAVQSAAERRTHGP